MLSVERPSGQPSCSSSLQAHSTLNTNTDGAASSSTALTPTLDPACRHLCEPPASSPLPPRFSIRDYVLSSRTNDLKKNWPFHLKFLRCLLEHDIHDLLPPFEPPDLVRLNSSEESAKAAKSCIRHRDGRLESKFAQSKADNLLDAGSYSQNEENVCSNPLMLKPSAQTEKPSSHEAKWKGGYQGCMPHPLNEITCRKTLAESTVKCNANSEPSNPISKPSCTLPLGKTRIPKYSVEAEVARPPVHENQVSSKEPAAKKCKLVVAKASATLDTRRGEEASINSGTVSDSMASKVCPVCKIFSSTSNTTLNAHIDQCLSTEPEPNRIIDTSIKNKVKPTKKRLMVDIYTTASCCTLEDLDRRNGSNWATDSSLTLPIHDVPTHNRKEGSSLGDQINNTTENGSIQCHVTDTRDGAVFFDASGTKFCILSKLNSGSPVKEAQLMKPRKVKKKVKKQIKSACSGGNISPRPPKSVKLNAECKKFSSLKLLKDEAPLTSTRNDCPLTSTRNDCLMDGERGVPHQLQNDASQMKMKPDGPGIITLHVFSKLSRSVVKDVRSPSSSVQDSLAPSSQSVPSVSAKSKSFEFKTSQLTDGSSASSKAKSVKILLDLPPHQNIREKKSQFPSETGLHYSVGESPEKSPFRSGLRPRQSIPSGNRGFPRTKKKKNLAQKSGKLEHLGTMSIENRHHVQGGKPLGRSLPSVNKCKGKNLCLESKKTGKHRLFKESHQKKKKQTSVAENVFHEHPCKEMVVSDSENLDNFLSSQTGILINQLTCGQSKYAQSQLEMGTVCIHGRKDDSSRSYFEGASSESQVVNLGYQTTCLADAGTAEKSYMENISDPRGSIEAAQCGGPMATSNSSLESWSRLVENVNFVGGKESLGEALAPRTFNHDIMMHSGNNTSNVDVITSMEMGCQQEFKSMANSCSGVPFMECRMNTAAVAGLSDYATSSSNDGTEVPQGNSSVTSNRITYNDVHNAVVDSASSDTPDSAASIISDPVEESNQEHSVTAVVVAEGESISGVSNVLASACLLNVCDSRGEGTERYKMMTYASTAPKPEDWGGRGVSSDCSKVFALEAPKQCNFSGQVLSMAERPSVSSSHLRLSDNVSSCSHELTTPVGSSNLVVRSPHVEENREQPTCGDSKLTDRSHEPEPQFPPSPVFRLMGKNLLVPRKEAEHVDGEKTDGPHKSACDVGHTFHPRSTLHSYVTSPRSYESPQREVPEKWRDVVQLPSHRPYSQLAESLSGYHFQNVQRAAECNQTYQSWSCSENLHSLSCQGLALPCYYQKCMAVGQSPNHARPMIVISDSQESKAEVCLPPPNLASALCPQVTASNSQQLKRLSRNPAHFAIEMREMMPIQLRPGMYCSYARSSGFVQSGTGWNSSVGSGHPNPPSVAPCSKLTHSLYCFPSMR